jgi:hypothetical protein
MSGYYKKISDNVKVVIGDRLERVRSFRYGLYSLPDSALPKAAADGAGSVRAF